MMPESQRCPDCGARLKEGERCVDAFNQMLFWENENPLLWQVHHLTVLCYHLQHPGLYSAEGLAYGRDLLAQFVAEGLTPEAARRKAREIVEAGARNWTITARPGDAGAYERPIPWTMTAADVVAGGREHYLDHVRAWARATHEALQTASSSI